MEEKKLENNIIEVLNNLHKDEKHQEIIDKIEAFSSEEMNLEIIGILARAYNNVLLLFRSLFRSKKTFFESH